MTLSFLDLNICQFSDCGLHFASLHDLLQHIEETHIPLMEEEMRKKEEMAKQSAPNDESAKAPIITAISVIRKLFPVLPLHKATPIKYEPIKLQIGHYKKKTLMTSATNINAYADRSRYEHDEESNDSFKNEDPDDYEQGADERRHKCPVEGCNKRYKNLQGARYHARQVHGYTEENNASTAPMFDLTPVVPGQVAPMIQSGAPSKYANLRPYKCSQCSKRYKTIVGLNNHVQQSHQRINTVSSQNLVPVSPSAVSIAATDLNTSSPGTPGHAPAEGDGNALATPGGYLPTTTAQNTAQAVRIGTQPLSGHQYQQQTSITKLLPTTTSGGAAGGGVGGTGARNMNMLSSYGPQPPNKSASFLMTRTERSVQESSFYQSGYNK